MTEPKYTPGPWEVRNDWYIHQTKPGSWSHAEVKCCPTVPAEMEEEHRANARLIAAAPDLLQLCRDVLAENEDGLTDDDLTDEWKALHERLRAVIQKATEGETP